MKKKEDVYTQGLCGVCGKNKQMSRGTCKKTGKKKYKTTCSSCALRKRGKSPNSLHKIKKEHLSLSYRDYKGNKCEYCGFIALHPCQLDVDHVDGNHKNNQKSNLQTLCANCHRLKTLINKEGIYK